MRSMPIGVIASGADPVASLRNVSKLGLECCQLSMPAAEWFQGEKLESMKRAVQETGVEIVGFFCHFSGESYADIPTIQRTVGLVNPETRPERLQLVLRNSDAAARFGAPALLAHIGFIPEDDSGKAYGEVVAALQQICDRCAQNGQSFGLETGQETAPALRQFIHDVSRSNLKVNLDPANMLLYGSGRPLEALEILKDYLISVHCKDGRWPTAPGKLGEEVPWGQGEVNPAAFIGRLKEIGFTGPLVIEREISGEQQQKDVMLAAEMLDRLRG